MRAIVQQRYNPEVLNPAGFIGGNVLIRCNIPSFVKDFVTVTSWLQQEPTFNIYPSTDGGKIFVYNLHMYLVKKYLFFIYF